VGTHCCRRASDAPDGECFRRAGVAVPLPQAQGDPTPAAGTPCSSGTPELAQAARHGLFRTHFVPRASERHRIEEQCADVQGLLESGLLDLNQRPSGPQPLRWSARGRSKALAQAFYVLGRCDFASIWTPFWTPSCVMQPIPDAGRGRRSPRSADAGPPMRNTKRPEHGRLRSSS
jgi:hypothetical protein